MEEINYVEYMPTKPPKAVFDYIKAKKLFEGLDVLVYKKEWVFNPLEERKERLVEVKCSCCKNVFYSEAVDVGCGRYARAPYGVMIKTEALISGDNTLCPGCGAECKLLHVGELNSKYNCKRRSIFPMHIMKVCGQAALVSWKIDLSFNKEAEKSIDVSPYEAYIFGDKRVIKLKGWYKYFTTTTYMDHWEQKKSYFDEYGPCDHFVPFMPYELNGTVLENSKLDIYTSSKGVTYPVSYAYMYLKKNNIENVVMQGGSYLISQIIKDRSTDYGYFRGASIRAYKDEIDFKKKRPCEMLGLTKEEFKWFVRKQIAADVVKLYRKLKEVGCNISKEEISAVYREGRYKIEELIEFNKNVSKCLSYIMKQRDRFRGQKGTIDFTMLKDYYSMLTDEKTALDKDNLYPKNLYKAHNDAVKRLELRKNKEKMKGFDDRYKVLKNLEFKDKASGLMIVPCRREVELRIEGKILHHCVASYAEAHATGKSNIFFIRKVEEPDEPFFTLELKSDEGKLFVNQNRGKNNCARTEIVIEFEKKWLEHIKKLEVNINGK